eukprot:gnl/TRDRNA2_/TRDRNA2_154280_c0_seq1.p1 gnl/TRDRNA2_/TRDRNA2_154280_c0~~gnl/TRDRNA2_/TRDRNA2_154280_c0_seq1.p1  ORF type:complete len:930 (-),score=152.66 gnl/TRDRNA2_/TRDRNA2_154280_c0_seq1:102-2891(-)
MGEQEAQSGSIWKKTLGKRRVASVLKVGDDGAKIRGALAAMASAAEERGANLPSTRNDKNQRMTLKDVFGAVVKDHHVQKAETANKRASVNPQFDSQTSLAALQAKSFMSMDEDDENDMPLSPTSELRGSSQKQQQKQQPGCPNEAVDNLAKSDDRFASLRNARLIKHIISETGDEAAKCHERWIRHKDKPHKDNSNSTAVAAAGPKGRQDSADERVAVELRKTAAKLRRRRRTGIAERLESVGSRPSSHREQRKTRPCQGRRESCVVEGGPTSSKVDQAEAAESGSLAESSKKVEGSGSGADEIMQSDGESTQMQKTPSTNRTSRHLLKAVTNTTLMVQSLPEIANRSTSRGKVGMIAEDEVLEVKEDNALPSETYMKERMSIKRSNSSGIMIMPTNQVSSAARKLMKNRNSSVHHISHDGFSGISPLPMPKLPEISNAKRSISGKGPNRQAQPFRRPKILPEVPGLRNRFRDQRVILKNGWRNEAPTVKRFHVQVAKRLGLENGIDWDASNVYHIDVASLAQAAQRKEDRARDAAATTLQKWWHRRQLLVVNISAAVRGLVAAVKIQRFRRHYVNYVRPIAQRTARRPLVHKALVKIAAWVLGYKTRAELKTKRDLHAISCRMSRLQDELECIEVTTAVNMQRMARGFLARKRYEKLRKEKAAENLQKFNEESHASFATKPQSLRRRSFMQSATQGARSISKLTKGGRRLSEANSKRLASSGEQPSIQASSSDSVSIPNRRYSKTLSTPSFNTRSPESASPTSSFVRTTMESLVSDADGENSVRSKSPPVDVAPSCSSESDAGRDMQHSMHTDQGIILCDEDEEVAFCGLEEPSLADRAAAEPVCIKRKKKLTADTARMYGFAPQMDRGSRGIKASDVSIVMGPSPDSSEERSKTLPTAYFHCHRPSSVSPLATCGEDDEERRRSCS